MSNKPAAIPLFADAYLADTMHLSTEEHGAYLLLLMAAWRSDDCSLPNDPKKLARIAGLSPRRWGQISATILDFWVIENGRIFNQRLRKERGYVIRKSESNRENARKRWEAQAAENKEGDECERTSDGNAPPPSPPPVEPNGSTFDGKKSRGTNLPDDFEPSLTPSAHAHADALGPKRFAAELQKFRDYHTAKGSRMKDWQAAFRTWLTNAVEWSSRNVTGTRNTGNVDRRDGLERALDRRT